MGQKNNPIILRIKKTNQFWNSCWYSDHDYAARFLEDCKIKTYIENCSQQLRKISPVLFVKRQRGDLQIAVFSAKFTRLSEIVRRAGRSLQKNVFPPRFSVALGSPGLGTESNKIKKHPLLFSATPHLGLHVDQQLPGFKGVQPVSLISLLSVCGVGSCSERITSTIGSGKSGLVEIKKSDLKKGKACFSYSLVTSKVKKKAQQAQEYALQPQINFFKESVSLTARKFPGISPERKNTVKKKYKEYKEYKKYGGDFLKFLLFAKRLGVISSPFFAPIPAQGNAVSKYTKTFFTTESGFTQNPLIPKDMKISPSFMSHEKHSNLGGYDITESLQNGDLPQRSCGKQMLQNKKKTIEPQRIIGWSASQPLGIASSMQQTTVEKPVSGYHLTHQLKRRCVEDAPLTPFAFFQSIPKDKSFQSSGIEGTKQKNTGGKNKKPIMLVNMPVKNYMEHSIYRITQLRCKIQLLKCPSIHQNPFFLAGQVVSLLQERVPFRQLKHRIIKEIKGDAMIKGVRILCSGRVASRSKKAQKARRESVQWGSTSLNVFSECLHFASCFAQTTFGKVGVKVWICYEKGKIRNLPIKPPKP